MAVGGLSPPPFFGLIILLLELPYAVKISDRQTAEDTKV
jgi:hypothetical protein